MSASNTDVFPCLNCTWRVFYVPLFEHAPNGPRVEIGRELLTPCPEHDPAKVLTWDFNTKVTP